jgi:hypothetical protein
VEEAPALMVRAGVKDDNVECAALEDLFWKYETRIDDIVKAGRTVLEKRDPRRLVSR